MKPGRVLLFGLGVVVLLLLAAVAIAFTPGFQTWAVRQALAEQPGWNVTVGRVAAGLNRVRLENVRVVREGAILILPTAEVELPVWPAVWHRQMVVQRLHAHGWTLDLTHAPLPAPPVGITRTSAPVSRGFSFLPAAYADAPVVLPPLVFAGIFRQLQLPVDVSLEKVDLAGEILLPALPNQPAARAQVTLTGGDLATGHPGKFDYTAVIRFEGEGVAVREVRVSGTLGVVMDTPRTFTRFVAAVTANASGPKVPEGVRLVADLSAVRTAADENYAVALRNGSKQIASIETSYAAGESHLRGAWRLDMHDADLAPFLLGRELPAFEAVGEGRFDLDTSFSELNASGTLHATADRLAAINPELAVVGAVHLSADFDVAQRGSATRVDRLAVTLTGAKPIGTVQALQAFEFNLQTGELNVADPAKDLLGVAFQSLPIAWIAPLLNQVGLTVTGHELQGEFAASARNGGFTLRPKVPLLLSNVSVTLNDGRPLLRDVDLTLTASADYSPLGWQVEFAPLAVSIHGAPLFALALKAGHLAGPNQPVKLAGDWTAQLPALFAQPPAAGFIVLSGGQAQGDFAASLGLKREFQIQLALTGLVANNLGALPALTANLRADLDPDGRITFNAPLVFDRAGRKSDITVTGTLAPGPGGHVVAARLTSDLWVINDVQAFALALLAAPALSVQATLPPGSAKVARPNTPFWSEVSGQCALTLKKVIWSDDVQVTDLTGTLLLDPKALQLTDGRARFGPDSPVKLAATLTFDGKAALTYGLDGDLALDNFDLGELFRAIDPTKPPTIEGRVNLQSHLTGASATLPELAARTRGDLRLTGKSGIFRAFSVDLSERIQKTQSRVAAIGSLLGVVTDDFVNKTKILAEIVKSLAEIPYDQLSISATRDESLNLQLKDFTLISPEVRIGGTGTIRYEANVPIVAQPLELQLALGTRGHLGDLMKRAGLQEAQQDNLGYFAFSVPLKLGGTFARPDPAAIRDALLNSALEKSGLLDSLFGGKGK